MRNVAGLSTSDAQKSSDMFLKCRYLDELTGNRGVIFATGTPISNSMTELYTMQRYTRDTEDTLYALGYTADEVLGNPRLKRGIEKAVTEICRRD